MLKLGDVPFINSKPLFYALENGLVNHQFDIQKHPPFILSKLMDEKKIDIGLIPVFELIQRGDYRVVPDISISSFGKVDSVLLISKKDITEIKSVALDRRSQSSSNLLRVIFSCFYGIRPEYTEKDYGHGFFDGVDAGMIIGDTGLRYLYSNDENIKIYDLGELWSGHTGLPFVYAVLAVNEGVDLGSGAGQLLESKSMGMEHLDEICMAEYEKIGVSPEFCKNYLSNRIRYDLGEEEVRGIIKFAEYIKDIGINAEFDKLEFY